MPRAIPQAQVMDDDASPSQKIVREKNAPFRVTDEDGRIITCKPLTVLDHARLFRAVGGDHAANEQYMRLVQYAASIVDIDGDPGPPKTSYLTLEHRIEWMGDAGFMALFRHEVAQREAAAQAAAGIEKPGTDPEMAFKVDVKNS